MQVRVDRPILRTQVAQNKDSDGPGLEDLCRCEPIGPLRPS
jgi:hypothetical protein